MSVPAPLMTASLDQSSLASGSAGQSDLGSLLTNTDIGTGAASNLTSPDLSSTAPTLSAAQLGTGAAPTTGTSSLGSDIGSLISSFGSSGLGSLAEYGGLYSLISGQAKSAANQNNTLAGQITGIGSADTAAGTSLLGAYTAGNLTAPYASQVSAAQQQNQLTATSQEQQAAQLLANSGGGENITSATASETGQISQAQALANTKAVNQAFQQELSDSLQLTSTGGAFVQAGIQQEIASNTELQGQLTGLMAMLAQSYATSTSGAASAGGFNSVTSGLTSVLGSLGSTIQSLLGGSGAAGTTAGALAAGQAANGAGTAAGTSTGSSPGAAALNAIMGAGTAANLGSNIASDLSNLGNTGIPDIPQPDIGGFTTPDLSGTLTGSLADPNTISIDTGSTDTSNF